MRRFAVHYRSVTSEVVFKIKLILFFGYFDPINIFFDNKLNSFPLNQCDISVQTAKLSVICQMFLHTHPKISMFTVTWPTHRRVFLQWQTTQVVYRNISSEVCHIRLTDPKISNFQGNVHDILDTVSSLADCSSVNYLTFSAVIMFSKWNEISWDAFILWIRSVCL